MEMDNIDVYGYQTKDFTFKMRCDLFFELAKLKRGTIYKSCIANELHLINDKKGVYKAFGGEYMICDIEKDEEYNFCTDSYYTVYKCDNLTKLEKYYNENKTECGEYILSKVPNIREEISKEVEKLNKNSLHYYELECKNKWGHKEEKELRFYLENNTSYQNTYIEIVSDKDGIGLSFNGFNFNGDKSFTSEIFEIILKAKEFTDKIKKIKNGYIFDDEYFKTKEDLIIHLEENYAKSLQK